MWLHSLLLIIFYFLYSQIHDSIFCQFLFSSSFLRANIYFLVVFIFRKGGDGDRDGFILYNNYIITPRQNAISQFMLLPLESIRLLYDCACSYILYYICIQSLKWTFMHETPRDIKLSMKKMKKKKGHQKYFVGREK